MNATAQMIFPDKATANAVLSKLAKRHPDDKFIVMQQPTGYQVARVLEPKLTSFPNNVNVVDAPAIVGVDLANAEKTLSQVGVHTEAALAEAAKAAKFAKANGKPKDLAKPKSVLKTEQDVYVALNYVKETALWLEVKDQGVTKWMQKSSVATWEIDSAKKIIYLRMPLSYAKKRALSYHFNQLDAAKAILNTAGVA